MTRTCTLLAASFALVLATGASSPAAAQPIQPSVVVVTADLDLASPAGQNTLDRRIARAVMQVCAPKGTDYAYESRSKVKRCKRETLSVARSQLAAKTDKVVAGR